MAKNTGRYVQFYTPGTAACKVEIRRKQEWAPLPAAKPKPKTVIHVDPVAVVGVFVAVCMLVLMAVGIYRLNTARREVTVLERYVAQLTEENQTLTKQYTDGYDLEAVRMKALDMGLVPAEQIPATKIAVETPKVVAEETVTLWNRVSTLLAGLFA